MERTRDISPKSTTGCDVRSASSASTNSQSSDTRNAKNGDDVSTAMQSLLLEAINETTAEANARSKEISELLSLLDIDAKSMPKDIQDSWAKVDAIMRVEGLTSLDEVELTLHMNRKKRETMKKKRDERRLKTRFNDLQVGQPKVLEKISHTQESVDSLEKIVEDESNNNERHVNGIVNAVKLNDYKGIADKTEEALKELGASDYFPDAILEKYKTYLELGEEINELDQSLSKYGDLPPNLSEARVMIAEKEKYLQDLEHAIFEKMK